MTNEQIAIDLCSVHHMTGDSGQLCHHCERIKDVLDERDADHRRSEAAFIELVNEKDSEIAKLKADVADFAANNPERYKALMKRRDDEIDRLTKERDEAVADAHDYANESQHPEAERDSLALENEKLKQKIADSIRGY